MANADEVCQYARLGQISKIQKSFQTHSVNINALNLYGESALSTAAYHNQIPTVEYLLANGADPKLRLSAGHTAVHIACRAANVPMLHSLLSIKREEPNEDEHQRLKDKHVFECLRIKDHANLTPIHWAATQESVSKRQKVFAYLDRCMPGVLDSRYNTDWFDAWARTHPWVVEHKSTRSMRVGSPIRLLPILTNTGRAVRSYFDERTSLPLTNVTPSNVTARMSLIDYDQVSRLPATATTASRYYEDVDDQYRRVSPKFASPAQVPPLPTTPITSCIVTSTIPLSKHESAANGHDEPSRLRQLSSESPSQAHKTPYSQRLSSFVKQKFSPLTDQSTYRAERAHVIPSTQNPFATDFRARKDHEYEDMVTPISSKRPSHNLLSNIVPSSTTPSSDHSSGRSSKPFASFGFDTSLDPRIMNDTTTLSTIEIYTPKDERSFYDDEDRDYLCQSASTLALSTPGNGI